MEHIRQSSQEHTSGSFYVAKDVSGLAPATYLGAILALPVSDRAKKHISVYRVPNLGNLEKDLSEMSGVGGFRRSATPGQALPLNVDQASLHHDTRPESAENPYHLRVAIHRKAVRAQAGRDQRLKELQQLRLGILRDTVLTSHNRVSLGIHQCNKAAGTAQECSVQDEVPALLQIQGGWRRRLLQLVIDHTVKLPLAMVALVRQLSGRVTFNNPAFKPCLLFGVLCSLIAPASPATRVPTRATEPTLFSFGIVTVSPENT